MNITPFLLGRYAAKKEEEKVQVIWKRDPWNPPLFDPWWEKSLGDKIYIVVYKTAMTYLVG
jgi:hypothetical protein